MATLRYYGRVLPPPIGLVGTGPIATMVVLRPAASSQSGDIGAWPMMIDTGAQRTLLDKTVCQKLGIPPIRFDWIIGVSAKPELCPVYRMGLRFGMSTRFKGWDPTIRPEVEVTFEADVIGMPVKGKQQHSGLLGRDFLARFDLEYHGPQGTYELVWKNPPVTVLPAGTRITARKNRSKPKKKPRRKR